VEVGGLVGKVKGTGGGKKIIRYSPVRGDVLARGDWEKKQIRGHVQKGKKTEGGGMK